MTDLPVRPHRKTLRQTAIIVNVSTKTVRRYLDQGKLEWSGDQVSVASIIKFLGTSHDDEIFAEVEDQVRSATFKKRRILSKGV